MIKKRIDFPYQCSSHIYCDPYPEILRPGLYSLEVWGASGGLYRSGVGERGKGGYSQGLLRLKQTTKIHVFIGGSGENSTMGSQSYGGNNGGGNATAINEGSSLAGGGGGTDIRINSLSLHARIIVAGGGGGCELGDYSGTHGGDGGGFIGGDGVDTQYGESYQGGGGTLNQPGTHHGGGNAPSFGIGGNADEIFAGGGGGGWYGGGAGGDGDFKDGQGGGGSGYIFTKETREYYPEPCLLSDLYFLENASTYSGSLSFPSPTGNAEAGHVGDGFARIRLISILHCTPQNKNCFLNIYISIFILIIK